MKPGGEPTLQPTQLYRSCIFTPPKPNTHTTFPAGPPAGRPHPVAAPRKRAAARPRPQDLIRLAHLNEPSVLSALARRYAGGQIYTNTGRGIIIALNPFTPMPHLYDAAAMEAYRSEGAAGDAVARAPHVYAVASQAYWRMRGEGKGQALLVRGAGAAAGGPVLGLGMRPRPGRL
jgi:hypothetical protein